VVGAGTALSAQDRERLTALIAAGEARTRADLVLVVAESCGGYAPFALLWPALAALAAGAVAALAMPDLSIARALMLEGAVFLAVAAVLQWRPALMATVPRRVRRGHARVLADQQFALRVAGRTRGATGMLLMVALAEREVFIFPDAGIAAVIAEAEWQGVLGRLVAAMRTAPAAAISGAIGEIVDLLAARFPRERAGTGELPDEVIELGEEGARQGG
jgi:putative membrane protein